VLQFGKRNNLNPFICVLFPHVICRDVYTLTTSPNEASPIVQAESRSAGVEFFTFHERRTLITLVIKTAVSEETQFRSQVSPRGNCGQTESRTGFSPSISVLSVSIIPPVLRSYILQTYLPRQAIIAIYTSLNNTFRLN